MRKIKIENGKDDLESAKSQHSICMTHLILILSCYVHWVLESGNIEAIKLIYCKLHLSMDSSQLGFFFCISFPLVTFYAAATPKQIRELMKVDGLTNDEVKSHLQVGFESRS